MAKMKLLAKMLATNTPVEDNVSFLELGRSGHRERHTVSSGNGVVEGGSEL